jgi:flagellar protein FliO/FliZ
MLPSLACAEGTSGQEFSFFSSFVQMIAALSVVIGLILVTRHFSDRFLGGGTAPRFASRHIRLLETRPIAPKKSLVLIEVGGEYLLLANTENRLTLLKKVDLIEEIEVIEEAAGERLARFGLFRRYAEKRRG